MDSRSWSSPPLFRSIPGCDPGRRGSRDGGFRDPRKKKARIAPGLSFSAIRLLAGVSQDIFGKIVFDARIVVQGLVISSFQKLLATLPQLLADVLLHAW